MTMNKTKLIKIAIILIYLFSPIDILPEAVLGPLGLVDDAAAIALLCGVVTIFAQKETKKFGAKKCGEAPVYGALLFLKGWSYANNENGGNQ